MVKELKLNTLRALHKLGKTYGVPIAEEIEEATGKRVSTGALYTILTVLEEEEYVISELGEATAKRGGRRKRYYELTENGRRAFIDLIENRSSSSDFVMTSPTTASI